MKIVHVDLETTGKKHWRNSVHQLGLIVEVDGVVKEQQQWDCWPCIGSELIPEALEISGKTIQNVWDAPAPQKVLQEVKTCLRAHGLTGDPADRFFLSGYNCAAFDIPFLEAWFVQNGDLNFYDYFWKGSLDVMVLAAQHFLTTRQLITSFSLVSIAKALNIHVDPTKLHSALYDAQLSREVYHTLNNARITSKQEH